MSKIIYPSPDLQADIVAGDQLKAMKAVDAVKAPGFYMVPPSSLDVMADFNVRVRATEDYEAQVATLMDSIRANGFMPDKPISVVVDADPGEPVEGEVPQAKLWVVDGHTRLEAVLRLIANENIGIETIPIVVKPKTTTFEDMLVQLVTSNSGKPLTSYETSIVVKRLVNYGWTQAMIAQRLALSEKHIGNLMVLAGAPAKIRNQVVAGKLSATEAVKLIRKHGAKATDVANAAVETAEKTGRKKAKPRDVAAVTSPGLGTDADALRAAINYACDVAADGIAWLKLWREGDKDTLSELEAYVDPNGGL